MVYYISPLIHVPYSYGIPYILPYTHPLQIPCLDSYYVLLITFIAVSVQLSVWSFHRLGHADFLGEVDIPFLSYSFEDHGSQAHWYPLGERVSRISSSFLPNCPISHYI